MDHQSLMKLPARRVSDARVLRLNWRLLRTVAMQEG
jgi:hypothetical protein